MTHTDSKIDPHHLARKAIVYLRQSSEKQVSHNLESQRMQYDLVGRARQLGFRDVEVVDCDLGSSASAGAARRAGFERILASVALKEVGLVLAREVSRLSRTDKDFCQLVELCQVFDTLVGDGDTIYNPKSMDDQLVLGIKGVLSVAEIGVLRMRMVEGQRNKAKRGELMRMLPPGYVPDGKGGVVKDPNVRVQEAISLVFQKFRETSSARQTQRWFLDNHIELPVNKSIDKVVRVVFQLPSGSFIDDVLHNPFYAGAYTYGRRPVETVYEDGVLKRRQGPQVPLERMAVLLRDHHEGYVTWETFEEIQRTMARNNFKQGGDAAVGAVRSGEGLLTGLLRCGRCGRKFHVRYWGKKGTTARYQCDGTFQMGGKYCQGFAGRAVDRRLSEEVVRVISPLGVEASLLAVVRLRSQSDAREEALARQVEQAEYEVRRAFEHYNAVDPRNRLVAANLEKRWNEKLQGVEELRATLAQVRSSHPPLSPDDEAKVRDLGTRFGDVWKDPACPADVKKRIIRVLIEEVVADEVTPGKLRLVVHWKGGVHSALELDKPVPARKNAPEDMEIIRKMAPRYGDDDIAWVLSKLGRTTGKDRPWTSTAVSSARSRYGIAGHTRTPDRPDVLTLNEACRHLDVSDLTVKKLVSAGIIKMDQLAPFAPWEIDRAQLDSAEVRRVVTTMKKTGRLVLHRAGVSTTTQRELFQENQGGNNDG